MKIKKGYYRCDFGDSDVEFIYVCRTTEDTFDYIALHDLQQYTAVYGSPRHNIMKLMVECAQYDEFKTLKEKYPEEFI